MKMTQYDLVLRHLQDLESITSFEAFTCYGITRLSAVIYDLRKDGYNIQSELMTTRNRYGNSVNYAKYKLI